MPADTTVVRDPRWVWALIWIVFPALGAAVGLMLQASAGWVAGLTWAPLQGPFRLVASIDEPYATVGSLAVGAAAGLALAVMAAQDTLTVTVCADVAGLRRGDQPAREFTRSAVVGVFADAKHLVLLGSGAVELARERHDLDGAAVRDAFTAHGWPWLPADPHAAEYRRWVPGDPGLPPGADALLAARAIAVAKGDGGDMAELRGELARLAVVVRDERKRQYWRRSGR